MTLLCFVMHVPYLFVRVIGERDDNMTISDYVFVSPKIDYVIQSANRWSIVFAQPSLGGVERWLPQKQDCLLFSGNSSIFEPLQKMKKHMPFDQRV